MAVATGGPAKARPLSVVPKKGRELKFVGEVVFAPLKSVRPNDWNPNEMSPMMRASLRQDLLDDGWVVSQSLLIWRTDERGVEQNVIIDGEHRWQIATELGFETAPMVFLDGLTREEASRRTVKFIQKHGEPNLNKMMVLVKTFEVGDVATAALDLGFDTEAFTRMLNATDPSFLNGQGSAGGEESDPNVAPDSHTLVFSFARAEDRDRVISVLDSMKEQTRAAALLKLAEKVGSKIK